MLGVCLNRYEPIGAQGFFGFDRVLFLFCGGIDLLHSAERHTFIDSLRIAAFQTCMLQPIQTLTLGLILLVQTSDQCAKSVHRQLLVHVLASRFLGFHAETQGQIDSANPGFHLVDVLTAFARGTEGLKPHKTLLFAVCLQPRLDR
jgi:hypothetical protein